MCPSGAGTGETCFLRPGFGSSAGPVSLSESLGTSLLLCDLNSRASLLLWLSVGFLAHCLVIYSTGWFSCLDFTIT